MGIGAKLGLAGPEEEGKVSVLLIFLEVGRPAPKVVAGSRKACILQSGCQLLEAVHAVQSDSLFVGVCMDVVIEAAGSPIELGLLQL